MHSSCSRLSASLCLVFLTLSSLSPALGYAQDAAASRVAAPIQNETVHLLVGDILEILPVHNLTSPQYTWILTQDRTFIEASRARTFRKRIIQPGTYTLFAEISAGDQSPRINRTFTLQYDPRPTTDVPVSAPQETGSGITVLVTADPAADATGRIILTENQLLLRLKSVRPDITPLSLDTHTLEDSNGDGNPASDVENDGTFFQTDATPLTLWFASPLTDRPMALTAIGPTGAPIVQELRVLAESYARSQGLFQSPLQITATPTENLTYQFTATFLTTPPATPILHHWEFGDGQQSILPTPTYTYGAPGTYSVTVRIQNLVNGVEIGAAEQQLIVQGTVSPSSEPIADPGTEDPTPDEEPAAGEGVQLSTMLLIGGVFLGALLFGILLLAIFMKLRGRNLDLSSQFASMEETLLPKEKQNGGSSQQPPTLVIPPAASTSAPAPTAEALRKREEERESVSPLTEKPLKIDEGNAPSWLKSGLSAAPTAAKPTVASPSPAMPVSPVPPKPATPPTVAIVPQSASAPKPASAPPPWMQQKSPTPAAAQSPAPSAPSVQPKPVSPPSVPSVPPPQPKPATPPVLPPTPAPKPPAAVTPPVPSTPPSVPKATTPTLSSVPSAPPLSTVPPAPKPAAPLVPQEVPVTPPWMQQGPPALSPTAFQTPRPATPPQPLADAPKPQAPAPATPPIASVPPTLLKPITPPPAVPTPSIAPVPSVPAPSVPPAQPKFVTTTPVAPLAPSPMPVSPPPVAPMPQVPMPVSPTPTNPVPPITPTPASRDNEITSPPAYAPAEATSGRRNNDPSPTDDSPVAFIRAESIEEQKKEGGPAQQQG